MIAVSIFHLTKGFPLSVISETCFNGEHQRPFSPLTKLYGIAPLFTLVIVSLIFDYLILRFVRRTVLPVSQRPNLDLSRKNVLKLSNSFKQDTSYEAIPARATILSSLTLVSINSQFSICELLINLEFF